MLKLIVSNIRAYNKVILMNSLNAFQYNIPLIIYKINLNKSLKSEQQLRSVYNNPNIMLGRLHRFGNRKTDSQLEKIEPKTQLESHFCKRLEQQFCFTAQECVRISMICRSALDSHLNTIEAIDQTIQLIANHFTPNDVFFNPQIFVIHSRTLMNRILILKELGFNDLQIVEIDSCFREILNETPNKLKSLNLYDSQRNPLQYFLNNIECPQLLKNEIENYFKAIKDIDLISFSTIRHISIAKYISWKLESNYEKALNIVDKKYSKIKSTSFSTIASNIEILMTKFKISTKRLKGSHFLITADFNNLVTIFKNNNIIAGKTLVELSLKYPQILVTNYSTLSNNIKLLKRFDITDDQILKGFNVLTLNTQTIEKRLLVLKESEDLKVFANNQRFLRIIIHFKSALDRLEQLKASGCLSITIDHLIGDKKYFGSVMLRFDGFGEKINPIEYYLSKFFETDYNSIKNRIGSHPYSSRLNIPNANRIVEFFIGNGLNKEQLVNGIFIVLYEYELVKHQYKIMANLQELKSVESEWKNDPFLLQLLIYYIEKNYGFTGNGVYMTNRKHLYNDMNIT